MREPRSETSQHQHIPAVRFGAHKRSSFCRGSSTCCVQEQQEGHWWDSDMEGGLPSRQGSSSQLCQHSFVTRASPRCNNHPMGTPPPVRERKTFGEDNTNTECARDYLIHREIKNKNKTPKALQSLRADIL